MHFNYSKHFQVGCRSLQFYYININLRQSLITTTFTNKLKDSTNKIVEQGFGI